MRRRQESDLFPQSYVNTMRGPLLPPGRELPHTRPSNYGGRVESRRPERGRIPEKGLSLRPRHRAFLRPRLGQNDREAPLSSNLQATKYQVTSNSSLPAVGRERAKRENHLEEKGSKKTES